MFPLNIYANTKPSAIEFVTYGKKNTVWYNPFNGFIAANATETANEIKIVSGTDINAITAVLITD